MRLKSNIAVAELMEKQQQLQWLSVMETGNLDPTVVNGGIIQDYGSNARLGEGGW